MAFTSYPTVTIGSEPYDVYVSLEDAENYAAAMLNATAWDDATDNQKSVALVTATRTLDRQQWKGTKEDEDNALEFPRAGTDAIPQGIADATVELAVALLGGSSAETSISTESLEKRIKAGSVEIENFRARTGNTFRFPLPVQELIRPFLAASGSRVISSGTSGETTADDDYGFTNSA